MASAAHEKLQALITEAVMSKFLSFILSPPTLLTQPFKVFKMITFGFSQGVLKIVPVYFFKIIFEKVIVLILPMFLFWYIVLYKFSGINL